MNWLRLFERRGKSPEHDLQQLVNASRVVLGSHLKSIVLFGSMASGEFDAQHSDVNVLIVTEEASYAELMPLAPALTAWTRKGHVLPILAGEKELSSLARTLPIEFLDMRDYHRVCYGADPIADLSIDSSYLRYQCQHELSVIQLKVRKAAALHAGNAAQLRTVLSESVPSVLTLCRGVLRLKKDIPKMTKIEAAEELGRELEFDGTELRRLYQRRFRRATDNLEDLLQHYLRIIDKVLKHLRNL